MPEAARVLHFPRRPESSTLSVGEVLQAVRDYFVLPASERDSDLKKRCLANIDIVVALCAELRKRCEVEPAGIVEEASDLYDYFAKRCDRVGLFDERNYVLGDLALIAGTACRHVGKREESEWWLDRAENSFLLVVNAAPLLAKVSYARLALWHDAHRFEDILERIPGLISVFDRLGMKEEASKSRLVEAVALREVRGTEAALIKLQSLKKTLSASGDRSLLGVVLVKTGEFYALDSRPQEAMKELEAALVCLAEANRPMMIAQVKSIVGGLLRDEGQLLPASVAYRAAVEGYAALEMETWVAYTRTFLAETLLLAGRLREAEWEILAALPTIEEQRMVPEGSAALALLKESVRRRKTDPNALRELREHLHAEK